MPDADSSRQPCPGHLEQDFPYGLFVVCEEEKRPEYEPRPIAVGTFNHKGTRIIVYEQNAFGKPRQRAGRYIATEWHPKLEVLEDGTPNPAFVGAITDTRNRYMHKVAVLEVDEFEPVWAPSET
jgi:hypothetical protein